MMGIILGYFILILSVLSPILPIVTGLRRKSLLWIYACFCIALDLPDTALMLIRVNNDWIANIFLVGEFSLVTAFLVRAIFTVRHWQLVGILCGCLLVYFIASTICKSTLVANFEDAALLYFSIIVLCVLGMVRVVKGIPVVQIERSPLFVICTGLLLYAAGCIIIFQFYKIVDARNESLSKSLWTFHNVLNISKNIAVGYCLYLHERTRPTI